MKLGSGQNVDKKRLHAWLVMAVALCVLGFQSTAAAQDMSFDLDDTSGGDAGGDAGGGADMEFGTDDTDGTMEFSEEDTEAAADGGGDDGGGGGGGDIFDELSSSDDELALIDKSTIKRETETVEEIYAVQRMYVLRNGRFELMPSFSTTMNDQYVTHIAPSIGLNYWITNVLAVGANVLWYQGFESESDLNFSIRRSFRLAVPITEYQLGAHLNFTYVPIYGKFTMFNSSIFQWDAYLVGGVGMMRTRPVAVVDAAVRRYDFDWRVAFNAGIGLRVFVTRWLTIFGELRDYVYLEKLENLEVALGSARGAEETWVDPETAITNNFTVHLGATIFFPFTFEYRYPK